MKRSQKDTKEIQNRKRFKAKTIQSKIFLPFIILISITGIVIAGTGYFNSVKTTTQELGKSVEVQMATLNETFELFFNDIEKTIVRFTSNELLLNYEPENKEEILKMLQETQSADETLAYIYTGIEETAEMIDPSSEDLDDSYNPKERPWYIQAVEAKGETIWTEPYVDEGTGTTVITAARAYYNQNQLIGVFALDVSIDTLFDISNNITIGESGYVIILDQLGNFISSPDKNQIGTEVDSDIFNEIKGTGNQGTINYDINGKKLIIAFVENPTTGWIISGHVDSADFEKAANQILAPSITMLVIVLIISAVISYFVTRKITGPVKLVLERMKLISEGDISHDDLPTTSNDEVGQLVTATNEMSKKMRDLLTQIKEVSDIVRHNSEEVTVSVQEVKTGAEQISATMQELASGSESEANQTNELSSTMETLASEVEEANVKGNYIQSSTSEVLDMTGKGRQLMNSSTSQMEKIKTVVHQSFEKIQSLHKQSKEITNLVVVIQDIADQTNLLALNAAIEAARAGEHGKGFTVVAEEVRKLAEQVTHSVKDIGDIVTNIQNEINIVTESLQKGFQEVDQGSEQIEETNQMFGLISNSVTEMVENIKVITSALANISTNTQKMNASIQEIAAITEESTAGIEETAAGTEEIGSSMEEVANSSKHLTQLANNLNDLVNRFKL